ncbi:Asp23/Gls24 family envelope stress response protein [Clostridiisalibacter paucivorans]|uniref:Asp23/Gls24 family envelope stress response protein n=1 Tax=Clostridiisalibacter paucivorans TaxID=408753 RepID=UPI00047AAE81|nr:Asp23/Gls24 family envelope stress response protein [Clostridiisalibacter paucivorans]
MDIIALIGPSGTGKSYKAIMLAKDLGIEYIIDDGLLIRGTKVLCGKSAKREGSIVSAVKRALFLDEEHRKAVLDIIDSEQINKILIIGTSDKMINRITNTLRMPEANKRIYIEDISGEDEIKQAKISRHKEGKHVIPVPTFEIKKDFSGYFIDTLKIFRRRHNKKEQDIYEKTVVRPTFSYLGRYTISHNVIRDLVRHGAFKINEVKDVGGISIKGKENGIKIDLDVVVTYGKSIPYIIKEMQRKIIHEVDNMTSLNIISVNVFVKKIIKNDR